MVRALRALADATPGEEPVHAPTILSAALPDAASRGGDFAKLRWWGFLRPAGGERADGSTRNGMWIVEPAARCFLGGFTSAASAALVRRGKVVGFVPERVTVSEVLAREFDLRAARAAPANEGDGW